jgi:hypothetical protein
MSVWSTRYLGKERNYIVLKHQLPNVNYTVGQIKFRGGYTVVEKDSKSYFNLKKIPILRHAQEFPLTFLGKLPFITRNNDIKTIFGQDVYVHYTKAIQKEKEQVEAAKHQEGGTKCSFSETATGKICENDRLTESPSGYCLRHLLLDPKLAELGIEVPKFIPKAEKNDFRYTVINKLKKLNKKSINEENKNGI